VKEDMADALFLVLRKLAVSLGEAALEKIGTEVAEAAPILTDFEHGMKKIEAELAILHAFIGQVSVRKVSDKWPVRLAGGWWLMLICSERKVLLADCCWLVCSERKVLLAGG
jgi:hypothetical protein